MRILITILVNGLLVFLVSKLLAGVSIDSYFVAVITGLVLGLINISIKPVVTLLTLPITFFTLGLFLLVINGGMVLLADWLIPGFAVDGMIWAIIFTLLLSLLNFFLGDLKEVSRA